MADAQPTLKPTDARKTYRYLRVGMVVAVLLLGASIAVEFLEVGRRCLQTSISAYYYTPVRAIFVGCMMAVGFSLIVIKGRTSWEDISLNVAGMLAPVVAIAPTTDVGDCWSIEPSPLPIVGDDELAPWVVANVDNNFTALLIAGALGLGIALLTAIVLNRSVRAPIEKVERGTRVSLAITAVVLAFAWWLSEAWGDFYTRAHGFAALFMFVFLIGAVAGKAYEHRLKMTAYVRVYSVLAIVMAVGGALIFFKVIPIGRHRIFVLEAYEILLFAVFWIVQTRENWDEELTTARGDT
jgi:hypothetical protein